MPPVQALVALHVFWLVLLLPPIAWVAYRAQPSFVRWLGWLLLTTASLTLALLIGLELISWLPSVAAGERHYFGQRILFVLATRTEWPLVQIIIAGLLCSMVGKKRRSEQACRAVADTIE